jgi:hypothetical protein
LVLFPNPTIASGGNLMEKNTSLTRTISALLLFLSLSFFFTSAQAVSLYKWTDEEGNVHYSQSPPEDRNAEEMQVKDEPVPETPEQAMDSAPPEGIGQDPERLKIRQRKCEIARNNLAVYEASNRVQKEDGSIIVMSEEMRKMKIEEAQEKVKEFCP